MATMMPDARASQRVQRLAVRYGDIVVSIRHYLEVRGKKLVDTRNIQGHRARLKGLLNSRPRQAALEAYVGGGARYSIGHREKEAIAKHHELENAYVIDIGCGIGRLTQSLMGEPIRRYLGTDIISEIMDEARALVPADSRFSFSQVSSLTIPEEDGVADIVCAFSVMTHLLDEEVFTYFHESARVLRSGGIAVFSFLDYSVSKNQEQFVRFAQDTKGKRKDVLKWFEKDTLNFFAAQSAMELIEFQDAYVASPAKYPGQSLEDGTKSAPILVMGQSLAYFRKT